MRFTPPPAPQRLPCAFAMLILGQANPRSDRRAPLNVMYNMIWLFFISGLAICLYTLFDLYVGYGSKYWPIAMGKVLMSCVVTKTNKASSSNNKHYHPVVGYEYKVKNKLYNSTTIGNFVGFDSDKNSSENLIKFPENSEIKAFYFPLYPSISVLVPGMQRSVAHYIVLFTGLVISLGSAPVLFSDNPY